jgi:RNA polymerase sigma-70 factor, ECF subfamily
LTDGSDDDLMRLYRDGEVEAFDILFERHYAGVFNFARLMLRSAADAEEVLQETFLCVVRATGTYQPRGQFRTWLMRIVRNRCLNRLQAIRSRPGAPQGALEAADPPATTANPADEAASRERAERLQSAIERLGDAHREVLVLYAFERMSYLQIAAILDVPTNTVKTLIHRARAQLARELRQPDGRDS